MSEVLREEDQEYEVIDVEDLAGRIVRIGRAGENATQDVRIDASAMLSELPGAALQIAAVRPGERAVYLPEVTVSDGVITWVITEADTAKHGAGWAEVRAVLGEQVKKGPLFRTRVIYGLTE